MTNNDLTNFANFKPVLLSNDTNVDETKQYYQENGLQPDNEYMSNYLNSRTSSIPTVKSEQNPIDISAILNTSTSTTSTTTDVVTPTPVAETTSKTKSKNLPKNSKEFIRKYKPLVEAASKKSGVSSELMLAQIALESGWGSHAPGNNFGGIKADAKWKGKSAARKTTEEGKNGKYPTVENFRVYDTPEEGFNGYLSFLSRNSRYKPLVGISDPMQAAEVMSKTGYATDKDYKQKLQAIIKQIQNTKV